MALAATSKMQSGAQPGGLLFKLPVELRLEIYDLIFPRESVGVFAVRRRLLKAPNAKVSASDSVSILATCRVIHDEAKPVLYTNTNFDISCSLELAPAAWRTMVEVKWGDFQWLPRMTSESSINIQQAQNVGLNIMFTEEASNKSWGNTWLDWLPTHIGSISNLKNLHIKLSAIDLVTLESIQEQADHILPLLARLKCSGRFTAAMDPSMGDQGFEAVSYYNMLRTVKGTDKTQEVYTQALAVLSSQHKTVQHELVSLSTRLNSKSAERYDIMNEEGWRNRLGPRNQERKLRMEIQTMWRDITKLHRKLDWKKRRIDELEQRQQFLLGGLSTPLESV